MATKVFAKSGETPNMRSFTIEIPNGKISINGAEFTMGQLMYVLFENDNLKTTIPLKVRLNDKNELEYYDIEWQPHNFKEAQVYPFKWNLDGCNIDCSITSNYKYCDNSSLIYIRVCNIEPNVGENIIADILRTVYKKFYIAPNTNSFYIFTTSFNPHQGFIWNKHGTRPNRTLDTIYISEEKKNNIINRLDKFYKSKSMYDKYCVPYKRIHLFHGEPGTGKTSTIIALASYFRKNVAKLTITPQVNSQHIEALFKSVIPDTFLILEDVDSLFNNRDANTGTGFDFSTLLNCMDGITTVQSLVIFMTTNHVTKLDPAFMRPGRIDLSVEFSAPSREVLHDCLKSLAPQYSHEHEQFLDTTPIKNIAHLQKYLFDHIMDNSQSILGPNPNRPFGPHAPQ